MTQSAILKTDLVFAVEPFAQVYAERGTLLDTHWEEIAKNKGLLTLNVDEEFYDSVDRKKIMLIVTARHEGVLVGYFVWFIIPKHPHYKHVMVAQADIHFLLPEYRRGLNGYKLLKAARDFAQQAGARLFTMREKVGDEHPALMSRLGFERTDIVYTMAIEGA